MKRRASVFVAIVLALAGTVGIAAAQRRARRTLPHPLVHAKPGTHAVTPTTKVSTQCVGSVAHVALCEGATCTELLTEPCAPYACDKAGQWCGGKCVSDQDCAAGGKCNVAAAQCAWMPTSCKDPWTIVNPAGGEESCMPYRCQGTQCAQTCTKDAECAAGYRCADGVACVAK